MNAPCLISLEFPIWNSVEKKLINHYKTNEVINVIKRIDTLRYSLQEYKRDEDVRIPELTIARIITKSNRPPATVMTWVSRILKIYYCKEIKEALLARRISARFALCDLANRVGNRKYTPYIIQACEGTLTNTEFRNISKKFKGSV